MSYQKIGAAFYALDELIDRALGCSKASVVSEVHFLSLSAHRNHEATRRDFFKPLGSHRISN